MSVSRTKGIITLELIDIINNTRDIIKILTKNYIIILK